MSDFELGIINAARDVLSADKVRCFLFHLGQSVFRYIQIKGLQQLHCSQEDSTVRDAAYSMITLAFVQRQNNEAHFRTPGNEIFENFRPVYEYFEATYNRGRASTGRGRPRFILPHYSPLLGFALIEK